MKSLYSKLIIGFLVSIILSFSFAGYFGLKNHTESIERLTLLRLESVAITIQEEMGHADIFERTDTSLEDLAQAANISIAIVPLAQSNPVVFYGNGLTTKDLSKLSLNLQDRQYQRSGTSLIYKIEIPYLYDVYLEKNMLQEELIFEQSAILALGAIFVAGSFIFLVIADVIVKPIKRLTKATNDLAQGNYDVQVHYYGKDELATLSDSFNSMTKRLVKIEENRQKFISDISHEFQTPLTSIQGFAKILTAEQVSDEQRRRYAKIILEQSQRLSTLSKNMLQLTVLEGDDMHLEKKKYGVLTQLERIVEMQQGLAKEKGVDIVTEFPKGQDIQIVADEDRMEQVFINLINNAVKYTPEGGVVTIRVKRALKDIEVAVEDTGIGMSKEALAHIFDRFYRADQSRSIQGNGLGLAIVKRIVDLHEYKMSVESQEDVGSVFKITIPTEVGLFINKKQNEGHLS